MIWAYQSPVFAKAGYHVIAYSWRGHHNSEPAPRENPGTASQDLIAFLNIRKFYAVCVVAAELTIPFYWERPDVFNNAVLNFIGRHSNQACPAGCKIAGSLESGIRAALKKSDIGCEGLL